MNVHKIAVIAGDGIGPEVIDEGVKVLKQVDGKIVSAYFEKPSTKIVRGL